jgi:hypothetical protein
MMSADDALTFIEEHGVVLVAARGRLPCLVEVILGEPIKGSWWAHPASHRIFAGTHSGKHANRAVEFPAWMPESVLAASRRMSDEDAERILAAVLACGEPH